MKALLLDIETSPNIVYSWGLFNQNISTNQIIHASKVLCWAAKWLGEKEVMFGSLQARKPLQMLGRIHKLLDEADMVIHYNGKSFDIKHLNKEFLKRKMPPPSPFKQVDLLQTMRQNFKFPSNKLGYILEELELGEKGDPGGMKTWHGCLNNDKASWATMKKYNIGDVVELEKMYVELRPWIKGHPNPAMYVADKEQCPTCGGSHIHSRGMGGGLTYQYKRYQCMDCMTWMRGTQSESGRQTKYVRAG